MNDGNIIEWSPSYELQWSDFRFETNPDPEHDSTSAVGYGYTWEVDFDDRVKPKKFHIVEIKLVAEFHRNESFVNMGNFSSEYNSNFLLLHEQGHFDLAEELIPQYTKQVLSGCKGRWFHIEGNSDDEKLSFIKSTAQSLVNEQVDRVRQNFFIPQEKLYDKITSHGKIESKQKKYNERFQLFRKSKLKSRK